MRRWLISAIALLIMPAFLPAQSKDSYGGISTVNCANPNGTSYFGKTTLGSHIVLCDPAGHPYFGRGFYVFDYSSLGNDESGGNYNSYVQSKYGATNYQYTWETQEVARMKAWGFNMIGPESTTYAFASWPWVPSGTNPNKTPFVFLEEACYYSWINYNGWGTAPVKDLMGVKSSFWTGYTPGGGVTDYEDPAWTNFVNGESGPSGDSALQNIVNASVGDKSYLIALSSCDSDYTHGFGAGPEFDTQPNTGYNDWRLSWMVALSAPTSFASTRQNQIYTDPTVYSKKQLYTQVNGEYANVAALNTAWGSSYTTYLTSGTCYGSSIPSWLCTPGAAESYGTGDGGTRTFNHTLAHTTVTANSVGIFVSGTLVGGDNGSGTFYGPNLTGTITYSTGVSSITFSVGHAPAGSAPITVQYIANGWGIGTGLMDEDGRVSHQGWTGTNPIVIDGTGTAAAIAAGGGAHYASAGMAADMNTLDVTLSGHFASVTKTAITNNFPGGLYAGITTWATYTTPPNRYVIEGMAPYVDIMQTGGAGQFSQAEIDYIHTYTAAVSAPDMALSYGAYNTANLDSPFAWPGSSCTHSGTTVTCTVATPQDFSTSLLIQTSCTDTTYNVAGIYPSSASGSSVAYTAGGTPTNASTTCNVAFNDAGTTYGTQAARASAVGTVLAGLPNLSYTANGIHPYVMAIWWQWSDKQNEELSWGVVDTRDNAYNGVETTTSTVACSSPIQAYNCGGELRSGWGSDDGITPLTTANTTIDGILAGLGVVAAPAAQMMARINK